MHAAANNWLLALALVAVGVAVCAADDAPGASLAGILLLIASIAWGARIALRKT